MEAAEPAESPTAKFPIIPYIWLYVVFGIPYVILGLVEGFGTTFRSGEASTFICGALIGAVGENLIGRAENRSPGFRKPKSGTRTDSRTGEITSPQAIIVMIYSAALLAWNMYFAFQPKTVHYPPIDWVQIVAFAVTATQLLSLRFFLSDYYHDVMLPALAPALDEFGLPRPLLWFFRWMTRQSDA